MLYRDEEGGEREFAIHDESQDGMKECVLCFHFRILHSWQYAKMDI